MKGAPELLLELSTYALQDGRYVLVENMRQQLEEQIWAAASAGRQISHPILYPFRANLEAIFESVLMKPYIVNLLSPLPDLAFLYRPSAHWLCTERNSYIRRHSKSGPW